MRSFSDATALLQLSAFSPLCRLTIFVQLPISFISTTNSVRKHHRTILRTSGSLSRHTHSPKSPCRLTTTVTVCRALPVVGSRARCECSATSPAARKRLSRLVYGISATSGISSHVVEIIESKGLYLGKCKGQGYN